MARQGRKGRPPKHRVTKSDYFTQPGKRGAVIVLRKPIGNRATAKICGTMPSRIHAKMLVNQLERAESVVKDLFLEATDDGIEALEAVLAACCREVLAKGPKVRPAPSDQRTAPSSDTPFVANGESDDDESADYDGDDDDDEGARSAG
jgi:hypothetical protein